MTAALGLAPHPVDFPVVGNTLPIALLFTAHVAVAEYSAGAISIAPVVELWAARTGDPRGSRYARALVNSYYLVFSLGATLAVFAVLLLTGLWQTETGQLVNVLLPLLTVAFGLFLVLAPLLVWYRNSFDRIRPQRHAALGFAVAALQLLFVFCITGLDSYLITPQHTGLLGPALNPVYWPLLVHRLAGNVSWTALLLASVAGLLGRRARDQPGRSFQQWAARLNLRIGLLAAVVMPVDGWVMVEVLRAAQPGYFQSLVVGGGGLFIVQEALLGIVLAGGNLALALECSTSTRPRTAGLWASGAVALGMTVACLPAAVIGESVVGLRYLGLFLATAITAVHVLVRTVRRKTPRERPVARVVPARLLTTVGVAAVTVSLLMGYIKEHARGDYSVYGELTQHDAQQPYLPDRGTYP